MNITIYNNYSYGSSVKGSKIIDIECYPELTTIYIPEQYIDIYTRHSITKVRNK